MVGLRTLGLQPGEQCGWFALCANEATQMEDHPVLGKVPICDRCKEKVEAMK